MSVCFGCETTWLLYWNRLTFIRVYLPSQLIAGLSAEEGCLEKLRSGSCALNWRCTTSLVHSTGVPEGSGVRGDVQVQRRRTWMDTWDTGQHPHTHRQTHTHLQDTYAQRRAHIRRHAHGHAHILKDPPHTHTHT